MTKNILLTVFTVLFSFQSFAQTGLKSAFDEFAYSMEVEGAALSPKTSHEASALLTQRLNDLRSQGVTDAQLLATGLSYVKDEKVKEDMKAILGLMKAEGFSQSEITDLLEKSLSTSYAVGSSWKAENVFAIGIGAIMAYFVGLALVKVLFPKWSIRNGLSPCPKNYTEDQCRDWYDTDTVG